ncbi:MAG: lipid-binding SYLF domain-containing protein [Colwellia sp.]|nr:lipid-binding SYLF domain-containing protein [Colwellia sp.]MCW9080856.1 lipid-binding SYLF domain-containing protein [Colwellia sp.]
MKNILLLIVLITSLCTIFSQSAQADNTAEAIKNFKKSPQVNKFFSSSYGYAIFPTIGKGGFGVGGSYGEGSVYKQGKKTGTTTMAQVTIGFQLGGQAFSEIIFFENKESYDKFTSGNFEFSAQASAVAINAGANAKTSTTGSSAGAATSPDKNQQQGIYQNGMATFTFIKGGLMYEAALGGQKFSFEKLEKKD